MYRELGVDGEVERRRAYVSKCEKCAKACMWYLCKIMTLFIPSFALDVTKFALGERIEWDFSDSPENRATEWGTAAFMSSASAGSK
jgi:hypothetical protein